jgi:hypothetical protein
MKQGRKHRNKKREGLKRKGMTLTVPKINQRNPRRKHKSSPKKNTKGMKNLKSQRIEPN